MKIRNGFVSNSSSSSFIINGKHTCADVAKRVAEIMYSENNEKIYNIICNNLDKLTDKNSPIYIICK